MCACACARVHTHDCCCFDFLSVLGVFFGLPSFHESMSLLYTHTRRCMLAHVCIHVHKQAYRCKHTYTCTKNSSNVNHLITPKNLDHPNYMLGQNKPALYIHFNNTVYNLHITREPLLALEACGIKQSLFLSLPYILTLLRLLSLQRGQTERDKEEVCVSVHERY